jgi:sugar lactone lactonase YvrE
MTATFSPDGTGLLSIHAFTGVATLPGSRSVEFVFAQTGQNSLYKVQWIRLVAEGQTTNYVSKFYPSVDGDIDLLRINRFTNPEGLTLDPSGNLYVVDSATDSLYRFSSRGIERYSFGGTGSGERHFRQPSGVAVFDRTVYVADRGNNRVVRFKLSTDLR